MPGGPVMTPVDKVTFRSTRLRVLQEHTGQQPHGLSTGYIWFDPSEGTARLIPDSGNLGRGK